MSGPQELSREELLAALDELRAAVAERDAVIRVLLAEVEQLKRRAGMDSSNSSMPPGSDGPASRAKRAKKPKKRSPRPRGGQAGHEGHALAWRSDPDQITIIAPDACAGCASTLVGREGEGRGDVRGRLAAVRDHDHGGSPGGNGGEQLQHLDRGRRVQVAGRLVGYQQQRVVGQRAGDGGALLLAAGQGGGSLSACSAMPTRSSSASALGRRSACG
ncbi:DUF6444 domain-containing protein [Nonomuraea sp. B19D2]|uniref:DUF6444 domain-containing protein n=1 Tax=Nonomuraea sp. B19D2 TaxID=3159561 RepID=UPI0032D9E2CC